jgi:general secretion pathway protein H
LFCQHQYLSQSRIGRRKQQGFSLMEMLVVLIIIGLFMTVGARKLVDSQSEMKSQVRRFSTMIKKLRNRARLDNKTYRLVFDLPIEKKKAQSYWVEGTEKQALLLSEEQRKDLTQAAEADQKRSDQKKGKEKPDPQGFSVDSSVVKKAPATLPNGLYFKAIEIDGEKIQEFTSGRVYIYFFPQGYVQSSAIHLTDRRKLNWSLIIEGVTGQVNIQTQYRSLKDVKQ